MRDGPWLDGSLSVDILAAEDEPVVALWGRHLDHVRRSLARGFVQGRDTHAAQLPTRYAAAYSVTGLGTPPPTLPRPA